MRMLLCWLVFVITHLMTFTKGEELMQQDVAIGGIAYNARSDSA